jgi:predicted deacylase
MAAEAQGAITGEVVVVPFANPIGLDQQVNATHLGRHELGGGGNFNRNWPELTDAAAAKVAGKLTGSEEANVAAIRAALREAVAEMTPLTQLDSLRQVLAGQAVDADLVFDLHCDDDALMHLFVIPQHWPLAAGIAAELGCRAVMLSEDSGGSSFDEAFSVPWVKLAGRYPDHPIPAACLAGTVEFRGQRDVNDKLAEGDGLALFRILQRHGAIAGDPGPLPEALCEATPLSACEFVKAPAPGVLSYEVELGEEVEKDQVIAWLIDPAAEDPNAGRRAIRAGTAGRILSRRDRLYVQPGETLAKVVGSTPLATPRAKNLLGD